MTCRICQNKFDRIKNQVITSLQAWLPGLSFDDLFSECQHLFCSQNEVWEAINALLEEEKILLDGGIHFSSRFKIA